jgi:glucose/arabinose dehydrogenase
MKRASRPAPLVCRATLAASTALVLVLSASGAGAQQFNGAYGVKARTAAAPHVRAASIGRHLVAGNLNFPAAFTFAPDGRLFYAERLTGEIRIINRTKGTDRLFFHVGSLATDNEQGLLGLAFDPDFPDRPFLYAYATRVVNGSAHNQILRLTSSGGNGSDLRVLWTSSTAAASIHNGGHIAFGPDGFLYAVQGEAGDPSNAQDRSVPAGKVLRMTRGGQPAPGNPFGSRVFSYGLRNSYGFAFDPRTGRLWESENGPECNDELNRIVKGGNFGWGPHETCGGTPPRDTNQDGPKPRILPKRFYTPTIAPTGVAFCRHCGLGAASDGHLFFGAYNSGDIRRVALNAKRLDVASQRVVLTNSEGVLSLQASPGGRLFFSDSNAIYKLVQR